ncbi:MAG: poly-gamma-glutamate system protein [Gemmatimonadota bacterium]
MLAGFVSVAAWALLRTLAPGAAIAWTPDMVRAAEAMNRALASVAEECRDRGIAIDPLLDPNGTCLIGPEQSQLFTSLGQLEAKRTATNPDMAGLMVHLLSQAGVGEGDRVAVGASGSFPGLLLATLVAVEAMGAQPTTILSLGASSFGATRPDFHLGDIHGLLEERGFVTDPPVAVSLGGGGDIGRDFDPGFREELLRDLRAEMDSGPVLLYAPDLRENVGRRMDLYTNPAAFVNIGGAEANLGTSPEILRVPPGLAVGPGSRESESSGEAAALPELPRNDRRGVLFEMASRGVPVIHLLYLRGLALRYGLPWDPLPLPEPGSTPMADSQGGKGAGFWLLTVGYLLAMVAVFKSGRRSPSSQTVRQPR